MASSLLPQPIVATQPASSGGYNLSPSPVRGSGAYGLVPGQISLPSSISGELNSSIPGYSALSTGATSDINSELEGNLSPETLAAMRNYSAASGAAAGQPGNSPLTQRIGLATTGNTVENLQRQGVSDFNTFSGTQGNEQISPELQTNIAEQNATDAAAPDPQSAAQYALSLYQEYMNPSAQKTAAGYSYSNAGNAGTYSPQGGSSYGQNNSLSNLLSYFG